MNKRYLNDLESTTGFRWFAAVTGLLLVMFIAGGEPAGGAAI